MYTPPPAPYLGPVPLPVIPAQGAVTANGYMTPPPSPPRDVSPLLFSPFPSQHSYSSGPYTGNYAGQNIPQSQSAAHHSPVPSGYSHGSGSGSYANYPDDPTPNDIYNAHRNTLGLYQQSGGQSYYYPVSSPQAAAQYEHVHQYSGSSQDYLIGGSAALSSRQTTNSRGSRTSSISGTPSSSSTWGPWSNETGHNSSLPSLFGPAPSESSAGSMDHGIGYVPRSNRYDSYTGREGEGMGEGNGGGYGSHQRDEDKERQRRRRERGERRRSGIIPTMDDNRSRSPVHRFRTYP